MAWSEMEVRLGKSWQCFLVGLGDGWRWRCGLVRDGGMAWPEMEKMRWILEIGEDEMRKMQGRETHKKKPNLAGSGCILFFFIINKPVRSGLNVKKIKIGPDRLY